MSPLHRLKMINPEAYDLYKNNGIDLEKEKLEIAVCAQHNNGGLKVDIYWQSNVKGIFPIGEAAGIYGVYRPGGSALNSTQTGSVRCAEYINAKRRIKDVEGYVNKAMDELLESVKETVNLCNEFLTQKEKCLNVYELDIKLKKRMSEKAGAIRKLDLLYDALNEAKEDLSMVVEKASGRKADLNMFFYTYYNLISQICYISAMIAYIEDGGTSRGSYLVVDNQGYEKTYMDRVLVTSYINGNAKSYWENVRPIPEHDTWFENVWRDYREGNLFD
jgi:succinate dehydrogenase/fumarate reductase flavoprotein subunit